MCPVWSLGFLAYPGLGFLVLGFFIFWSWVWFFASRFVFWGFGFFWFPGFRDEFLGCILFLVELGFGMLACDASSRRLSATVRESD